MRNMWQDFCLSKLHELTLQYFTKEKGTTNAPCVKKNFGRPGHLKVHKEEQHSDARPFPCNICKQTFKRKHSLKKQNIVHIQRTVTIVCKTCQKTFLSKGNLKNHTQIHTGEKPFNCSLCQTMSFRIRSASVLKSHMRVHTDDD